MKDSKDHFGFEPTQVPPAETGRTVPIDAVLLRTERLAVLLRSLEVFSRVMQARIEIFRADGLATDSWIDLVRRAQETHAIDERKLMAWLVNDGDQRSNLHGWSGGGNDRHFRISFWGAVSTESAPSAFGITLRDEFEQIYALPQAAIAQAASASTPIW